MPSLGEESPKGEEIVEDAKSFYFDVALSGSANVLDTLLKWAPKERILYGRVCDCGGGVE